MSANRTASASPDPPARVLVVGGGVGGLEALLALRVLAEQRVALTLLADGAAFSYRPVAVLEPFVGAAPKQVPLMEVAEEVNAEFIEDRMLALHPRERMVTTAGGRRLAYDHCVIAVGARPRTPCAGATPIDPAHPAASLEAVLAGIERGTIASVGLGIAHPTWPLPAYELALLLARHARLARQATRVCLLTDEAAPLVALGHQVSQTISDLLAQGGVQLVCGVGPQRWPECADHLLALPALRGPGLAGLPAAGDGFIAVDEHGAVAGVQDVYAVGDATQAAVKLGGVAALQADAAAEAIAAAVGAPVAAAGCDGDIPAVLLTGGDPGVLHLTLRFAHGALAHTLIAGPPAGRWTEDAKLGARYLGAYLDERWADGPAWRLAAGVGHAAQATGRHT